VGQAEKSNQVPLVIPCHRVLGSDGSLTGYGGKDHTDIKAWLLNFEKIGLNQG
jgi:methylated-DNA-[protein]-cysteine S-methyltransferase